MVLSTNIASETDISAMKWDYWVVFICLFNELVDDVSVCMRERANDVDVAFSNERYC